MTKATEQLVDAAEAAVRELECHFSQHCTLSNTPVEQNRDRLLKAVEVVREEAEGILDKYTVEYLDIYGVWHEWSEERFVSLGHARRVYEEVTEKCVEKWKTSRQKFWVRLRQKRVIEDTVMQSKAGDW